MKKPKFKSYTRPNGHNEFNEFFAKLPKKDQQKLDATIKAIEEYGLLVAIQQEWIKRLDANLYEIRSKLGSNIQRGLYFHVDNNDCMITHGFIKKTQKTAVREINHAKIIRAEYYQERGAE
ncbi:type II toxin-antitoxin system RelE/ParE family toxin [Lactobacillus sp. ESL0791]|uniref:type II toxin-antitoxin system RelE/ParE family toxin n=1 Tax=Lactobacillus sp. ESL0791 TaxID=2983234 RepID=UPI0023FA1BFB|nr:type II toxin-antitoxin system RelE/ParE family toxin [Lactobacillus sp. ESL0791]MDF7638177.1 type II toxin-antitoxin system RelE/ParE family toxin [Lactobacillus sp. ESL0791]